jgi:hypothetical protein
MNSDTYILRRHGWDIYTWNKEYYEMMLDRIKNPSDESGDEAERRYK